jgi:hypothetical protein
MLIAVRLESLTYDGFSRWREAVTMISLLSFIDLVAILTIVTKWTHWRYFDA